MNQTIATLIAVILCVTAPLRAETLSLRNCLDKAGAANHALRVAAYDEKIAAEGVQLGRSGYLPRIDAQGGYTAQLEPQSIDISGRSIATQEADYGFFSLSVYQTLYDFGRSGARLERARAIRDAAAFGYKGQEKEVFLQVVTAYFGILQGEKLLQAADEEIMQMTDHLRIARNLYEQGVVTRNDLLQAEVRLANSSQRRLDAANHLENGWLQLNFLSGQPPEYRATLEESSRFEPATPEGKLEEALSARAEVKNLHKVIEGSSQEVKESMGSYYPELFARAGVDYVQNDRVKEQAIMAATIGVKVNLFDGMATTSRYRQAVQNRHRNEEALRQLRAVIRLEYQLAANDARVAAERIKATEKAIQQGEENLRINKDRYQAQVGTATEVIDAQTLLTQTKTDHYRSLYDYQVALARVKKALGEL